MKLRWSKERECNSKWYKQFNTCLMDYFSYIYIYILLIVYFIIFVNEVLLTISKFCKKYLNIFLYQWTQKKIIKLYLKKKHFKPWLSIFKK